MSTKIRPEVSKKNDYWISKHRYYELKHFCLQYPEWKKALAEISYISSVGIDGSYRSEKSDPTVVAVERREEYIRNIEMIERCCRETDDVLWSYILIGVTEAFSYDTLRVKFNIPCCKDTYYRLYREFFKRLDCVRK